MSTKHAASMTKICTTIPEELLAEVEEFLRTFPAAGSRAAVIREALRLYLDLADHHLGTLLEEDSFNPGKHSFVAIIHQALDHWVKRERAYQAAAERLGIPREEVTHREVSQAAALRSVEVVGGWKP